MNFLKKYYYFIFLGFLYFYPYKYHQWYSWEVKYSDWRGCDDFDYATNAHIANYYNTLHNTWEYKPKFFTLFKQRLDRGETLKLGVDYYALENPGFSQEFKDRYRDTLLAGNVLRFKVTKNEMWGY